MEKTYVAIGGETTDLSDKELEYLFLDALAKAQADIKKSGKIIIIPPDITRIHSRAGFLTEIAAKQLGDSLGAVTPALGTHSPMNESELSRMFGSVPKEKFLVHNWRSGITELGRLESSFVERVTEGAVKYDFPVQLNKILRKDSGNFSLALSIGQVVPHEVAGMANHSKNIFVGLGGKEAIDKSHFAGAAYGMERIMGRRDTPVRSLFDEGLYRHSHDLPPILWVLTVVGTKVNSTAVRGLFIGFGRECFEKASELAQTVNVNLLNKQVNKIVVYLDPIEYRTTWLGNKAVYRSRMAIADGGELIVIAPALERFGEDSEADALIRKYGYSPRSEIISKIETCPDLSENLSAAAHLIHGCPEDRFTVRYCPGPKITEKEIESAGFEWGDLKEALNKYDIKKLHMGWNNVCGEEIFFIPNPALGLWTTFPLTISR